MALPNVIPILRESQAPRKRFGEESPFFAMPRLMSRMFDELYRDFMPTQFRYMTESVEAYTPKIDVKDTEKDIQVLAELPGVDEKDIEISLTNETLTIKGEKKSEVEEKRKDYYWAERAYGSFYRSIPLPCEVKADKAEAVFKKGVLSVLLPKTDAAKTERKTIHLKTAE
ncbi:MAG TPA: Hsp20/alpha crystallin family protein [Bdellovibrionota bacterium]|nr:Hsp20/alpha crystallin family protein [Bdellovibrionota bacterium]